jgi:hypothetical protein
MLWLANFPETISGRISALEKKWGVTLTALAVGFILLAAASIWVAPRLSTAPGSLGSEYQALSDHPFDFSRNSKLQYRILTPLCAHVLGLRGALFPAFPLLMAGVLLATVYTRFRKENSPSVSAAAAAMIAFSVPVLSSFDFAGYPDTLSYLLIWLCLATDNLVLQCVIFALALFNHDNIAFAFPFLAWRPWTHETLRRVALRAGLFLLMFVPALFYRHYVNEHTSPLYTPGYYLDKHAIVQNVKIVARYAELGIFEAFRLFWILPLAALCWLTRERRWNEAGWIVLVFVCTCLQLVLAFDTSRYMGLAFPCVLYSVRFLQGHYEEPQCGKILWLLFAANFLIPVYFIWEYHVSFHLPWPIILLLKLFGIDGWKI